VVCKGEIKKVRTGRFSFEEKKKYTRREGKKSIPPISTVCTTITVEM
jgi:hypothetical protein